MASASSNTVRTVGVIGTGVIGASWTSLFLSRGLKVIATDPVPGAEDRLKSYIRNAWPALKELQNIGQTNGHSNDDSDDNVENAIKNNLRFENSLGEWLKEVDYVQENTPERLEMKLELFEKLDKLAPANVPLVSSSSGFPSSQYIVNCQNHPERVLVAHPFNPPHLIPGVEVVPHPGTTPEAVEKAMQLYKFADRRPILVKKETPGFVGNRLQAALCSEAYSLVKRGIVSPADIDAIVADTMAMRWAIQGVFQTKVLSSGGGRQGFRKHRDKIGPPTAEWLADMRANQWEEDEEAEEALRVEVDKQLEVMGDEAIDRLPQERDLFIMETLKLKKNIEQAARK